MKRNLSMTALILVTMLFSLCIETTYAQATSVTLKPTDDTYVESINPSSNYGGQNYLDLENSDLNIQLVWLKFDLSAIPNTAIVDLATLHMYATFAFETLNVEAYSCLDNSWNELTLTYSNMPNYNNASPLDSAIIADAGWYNWSVVDSVRNALNSNLKAMTIVLSVSTTSSGTNFPSKENPFYQDYPTILTIHWSANTIPTPSVPEFQSWIILAVIMTTILSVAVIRKRKIIKKSN